MSGKDETKESEKTKESTGSKESKTSDTLQTSTTSSSSSSSSNPRSVVPVPDRDEGETQDDEGMKRSLRQMGIRPPPSPVRSQKRSQFR